MLSFKSIVLHCIFLSISCIASFARIAADTEVSYELVAEPIQEPPAGEQQIEEAIEPAPEEVANPADLQGKPQSITLTFSIPCLSKYCAFMFIGVV